MDVTQMCPRCGATIVSDSAFCAKCGLPQVPAGVGPSVPPAPEQWATQAPAQWAQPAQFYQPPAARRRRVLPIVVSAIGLAILVAAGAFVVIPRVASSGHTIQGLLVLWTGATGSWSTCAGTGGYSDISAGGNVRITSGNGDTIGGGFLKNITEADLSTIVKMDRQGAQPIGLKSTDDAGAINELRTFLSGLTGISSCALWWEVPNVPGASIYGVEVTHRGVLNYDAATMEKNGWVVGTTLGHA